MAAPIHHGSHGSGFTFEAAFHGAAWQIADPAGDAMTDRFLAGVVAVGNTLHSTGNNDLNATMHGLKINQIFARMQSFRRTLVASCAILPRL